MPAMHHNHPESEERDATPPAHPQRKHQAKFDAFPATWQVAVVECERFQRDLQTKRPLGRRWSDEDFVSGTDMAASSWNMLRNGSYPMPTTDDGIRRVTARLENLRARCKEITREVEDAAIRAQQSTNVDHWVDTKDYQAIKAALRNAERKVRTGNEERMIVFIAPTRGGKSFLKRKLMKEGKVTWEVSARPSWSTSYRAVLEEFGTVFDLPAAIRNKGGIVHLEDAVLRAARSTTGVIWIEEIQAICKRGQELIKVILNQTTLTVIVSLTPGVYELIKNYASDDESQLLARAEMTLWSAPVQPDWIKSYAPDLWTKRHTEEQLEQIAEEANARGALSLVREVSETLIKLTSGSTAITDSHVRDAIALYRMAVPRLPGRAVVFRTNGIRSNSGRPKFASH